MATAWKASTHKDLQSITRKTFVRPGHTFVAPPAVSKLAFSRADLCLSMAMTSALSGATTAMQHSLNTAMAHFVRDHVDNHTPTDLQFLDTVDQLADSTRTYFSSCIGAGVADQYVSKLGFRFRCNSRELKLPQGRVGDFLYDGGIVPAGSAVMVEAKGSLRVNFSSKTFKHMVEGGYTGQVRRHVGKTYLTNKRSTPVSIVHGYAVGCGGSISVKYPAPAIGHVAETRSPGSGGGSGGGGGGGGGRSAQFSSPNGNAAIVLGNYRAVATLLGATDLIELIDQARNGERVRVDGIPESLTETSFRGDGFFRSRDPQDPAQLQFAIWKPMLKALLENLRNDGATWEMPVVPERLFGTKHEDSGRGALQSDGLALLAQRREDEDVATAVRFLPPEPADRNREEEIMTVIRYVTGREGLLIVDDGETERRRRELEEQAARQLKFTR